ncbi:hypothetical protein M4D56_01980 [Cytobacillus oceanisediminis]|uniref:GTP pyrophosphokinase n=1 Tax=Cytobacillus oceanisediminis TaxID=665099 RepID=UPI00203F051D|nr:hypothetical protein [Cytobacillus oceanisediminis]MCM3527864.1 hypothetical protein [Cytobacillus oceanisediminis]
MISTLTVKNTDQLSKWYKENRPLYESLSNKVEGIIQEILQYNNIEVYSITSRAKEIESFIDKAKKDKYTDPMNEIKDLAGIRVITFVKSDVEKCCDLIKPLFKIDESNSIDKGKELGKDKVGYRSVHYIAELTDERLKLPEYAPYKDMCFEIQVRTILEHAWADISHDRTYKFSGKLPQDNDIERRFSLAAATLELVDREFDAIAQEIDNYRLNVINDTTEGNLETEINSTSLHEYMKIKFKQLIANRVLEPSFYNSENKAIEELAALDVKTLSELDHLIGDVNKFNKIPENTFLGVLRDAMIIYDADAYFSKAWLKRWNEIDPPSYQLYLENNVDIDRLINEYDLYLATQDTY